ncbi:methyltransferase-like protein 22 [Amphiura filiformis]|uniref:methyltransferase-like protein 22 n=1 Tax=Amphiura filiformis TaxID=82378 RepID=UPI003B20FEC9
MCDNQEFDVLSDVHVYLQPTKLENISAVGPTSADEVTYYYKSRFTFRVPQEVVGTGTEVHSDDSDTSKTEPTTSDQIMVADVTEAELDEDGDLVVKRHSSDDKTSPESQTDVIMIDHCMSTSLADVGLQVWQGSLLMCDFILSKVSEFKDSIAVELGGGLGLSSIAMAMVAKTVYCTDVGNQVLTKCQENIQNNSHLFDNSSTQSPVVFVRELDWTKTELNKDPTNSFSWRNEDEKNLAKASVIFAADVIYDNHLTDAFFKTLVRIMHLGRKKTTYISLERRYNFTLSDLDVTCKEYDYFRSHLTNLVSSSSGSPVQFSVNQISTDFTQYFNYNRVKQIELWQITASSRIGGP